MLSNLLIDYCSPTLAGIKSGSLFNCVCNNSSELNFILEIWNEQLNPKGVNIAALKIANGSALLYVYRERQLVKDFKKEGVSEFLTECGYDASNIPLCIKRLSVRINKSSGFPHEIGLFLGYPLGDVTGFIENNGKNSLYTGYWKVYCNKNEAIKTFEKYKKCKKVYQKLYNSGKPVMQLTMIR